MPRPRRYLNIGDRYGRLVVESEAPDGKTGIHRYWCVCDCGTRKMYPEVRIRNGGCKSCGCLRAIVARAMQTKHGHGVNGGDKLYYTWQGIKRRCLSATENPVTWARYGGRGITVCNRWLSFENFAADMGEPPSKQHTIERIDNNGNYEPSNCRWATRKEQARNTRNNRMISAFGKTMCIAAWGEETGIGQDAIERRLSRGWDTEKMLTKPARKQPNRKHHNVRHLIHSAQAASPVSDLGGRHQG